MAEPVGCSGDGDCAGLEAEQLGLSAADLVRMRVFGAASMRKLLGAEDLVEMRRLLKNMTQFWLTPASPGKLNSR